MSFFQFGIIIGLYGHQKLIYVIILSLEFLLSRILLFVLAFNRLSLLEYFRTFVFQMVLLSTLQQSLYWAETSDFWLGTFIVIFLIFISTITVSWTTTSTYLEYYVKIYRAAPLWILFFLASIFPLPKQFYVVYMSRPNKYHIFGGVHIQF